MPSCLFDIYLMSKGTTRYHKVRLISLKEAHMDWDLARWQQRWQQGQRFQANFSERQRTKNTFLDQPIPPVKTVYHVRKQEGKQRKKPACRVRSFRPIYYSKPFLSLQQHSTKKACAAKTTTRKWEQNWEQNRLTLVNVIGQKWTKFVLLLLYSFMKPPFNKAERVPSEVQILSPRLYKRGRKTSQEKASYLVLSALSLFAIISTLLKNVATL